MNASLLLALASILAGNAYAAGVPDILLKGEVVFGESDQTPVFAGSISISNWSAESRCLYLPLNDPQFVPGGVSIDYFRYRSPGIDKLAFVKGRIEVKQDPRLRRLSPYLLQIESNSGPISLNFQSKMPRGISHRRDIFFENFHPILLSACPVPGEKSRHYQLKSEARIRADVKTPKESQLAIPLANPDQYITSSSLAFAVISGYQEYHLPVVGLDVLVYHRSAAFLDMMDTVQSSLASHAQWFGPFPFPRLIIIESGDLEKHDLPGIVALNTPQQQLFHSFESEFLNWNHWVAAKLLAYQWYGTAVRARSPDDAWLVMGIADFATLNALKKNMPRYNLFNLFNFKHFILSLNYLQAQELATSLLSRNVPECPLTNADLASIAPYHLQHGYLFLRHSVAMRHMKAISGEETFQRFMRLFTADHIGHSLDPESFREGLNKVPSPFSSLKRAELAKVLNTWWVNGQWPDFKLLNVERALLQDGRWLATVTAEELSGNNFPVPVQIRDASDIDYFGTTTIGANGSHTFSQVTQYEPETVVIDPNHTIYDKDRFNNNNKPASLNVFPGNAKTLEDGAYTVAWLPYPFKRPGDVPGFGIQLALLKYVDNALILNAETDFDLEKFAYQIQRKDKLAGGRLSSELAVSEDFGGYRVAKGALYYEGSPPFALHFRPSLQLRQRSIKGQADTAANSGTLATELVSREVLGCHFSLSGEIEQSLPKAEFSYQRSLGSLGSSCTFFESFDLELRFFRGKVTHSGDLPTNILFYPERLDEARLRLDEASLAPVASIGSFTSDAFIPFSLRLPANAMVVANKLRFRLFFDAGRAFDTGTDYRASGLGFLVPLGGDLTGVGSLSLTRFTLLAVIYSSINGEANTHPRLLFDLSSSL